MITVRCPACDAAYQLDAAKLADGGRKLKCARCKVVWLAQAAPEVEAAADVSDVAAQPPEVGAPEAEAVQAGEEGAAAETPENDVLPETPPADVPVALPLEDVVQIGGWRQWVRGGNLWRSSAVGLVIVGLLTGAGVTALRLMPPAPDALQEMDAAPVAEVVASRMVEPPAGLVLHSVRDEVTEVEHEDAPGTVALTVRGLLTNTTSQSVMVPNLQLELLGDDGQVADMWPVSGVGGPLEANAEQAWTVSLSAPDLRSIAAWRVVFVAPDKGDEAPQAP